MDHLRRLGSNISVSISADENRFTGRECPQPDCEGYFKIELGTGLKGDGLPCHCPYCGHAAGHDQFWTKEQIEYARSVAMRRITDAIRKDFRKLEFDHKPKGAFGIGFSMKGTSINGGIRCFCDPDVMFSVYEGSGGVIQARQGRNSATRRCFHPISCLPSACSLPAHPLIPPTIQNAACCRPDSATRPSLPPAPCQSCAPDARPAGQRHVQLLPDAANVCGSPPSTARSVACREPPCDGCGCDSLPRSNTPLSSRYDTPSPPTPPRGCCSGPATPRTLGYRAPTHPSPDRNGSACADDQR